MTEPVPGTVPVSDQRKAPRGVLPRSTQTWLMVGLAVGILGIIVITGHPEPAKRPASTANAPTAPPSADRVREYQDRLRLLEERARQQIASTSEPAKTTQPPFDQDATPSASPDPLAEDRRRRNYESLFASNVVLSRRPDGQRLVAGPVAARTGLRHDSTDMPAEPPSIDAVADAVVRASSRYGRPETADSLSQTIQAPATAPAARVTSSLSPGGTLQPRQLTEPIVSTGSTHRLLEGTVIDTVLTNRLDGSSAAPVNCLVTNAVYSHDGQYVLIPAGARVLGETKPVQSFGDTRIAVSFTRLILPNGSTFRLDQFTGLNGIGDAGLRDQVNQHYRSTFGAAAAIGLITGLGQFLGTGGFSHGGNNAVVIAGGVADATSQATAQTMNRFLNRLPTVTIREGHRVKVYLTSDIELPPYLG